MLDHWQAHKDRLRAYLIARLPDEAAVDDALQEIYLKAHSKQHQLREQQSLGAWLYRIAHNTIMDHYRRHPDWAPLDQEPEAPQQDTAQLAHQELAQCLRPLINELPEKYGLPLTLADLEGKSQQQVAEQLGLSLSGAKSRVQRGREKLRQKILACCALETGPGGVQAYTPKGNCDC
ncbi:RNA polymerase sigma factor SigZ [Ferrimonas sp. YFM]|uniref:RNA polymerase sigma factor SigZ n=1 Tax=Ferrimonas sp. YFM TaxID=3028878 RepID=UPI002574838B|nr:RNA polymerase sigma factor SigZ [Ferrimonas sp. YFM]BDY03013.1 RNA polymerase sigma factor SigZ [Ferrimonas sp. YFM]